MIQQQEQHQLDDCQDDTSDGDDYSIWFAVPKRKHTRSRKRMKTTSQKKLPLKKNIIFDPRTGEVSLMHKLPFNWKDYLPKMD
jgi:ribosomal protein L32